jgi:hypothetical protein
MKILTAVLLMMFFFVPLSLAEDQMVTRDISFLSIPYTDVPPVLDGDLSDDCWQQAAKVNDFVLTAGEVGDEPQQPTYCRLLYDDSHLYISFQCKEADMENIKAACERFDDEDILYDDRVEVFLDLNHDHRFYYEMAVNPAGVQFDQSGYNRLHGSKTCDFNPGWNARWRAKTALAENEWFAEIAIDLTTFGIDILIPGMTWGFNLARVRQPDIEEGGEFFKREPQGAAEYSAWSLTEDTIRESISNFHAPLHFGDLVIGDPGFKVEKIRLKSAKYAFGPLGVPSTFGWNPLEITFDAATKIEAKLELEVIPESEEPWKRSEPITISSGSMVSTSYWIPEMLENKIVMNILDRETDRQLYRTSYVELTPPFIEYNLEPLYTRNPAVIEPLKYRMMTDAETAGNSSVELIFKHADSGDRVANARIEKPSLEFSPVFDIAELRKLPGGNYVIESILFDRNDENAVARFQQHLTKFDNTLPETFYAVEGDYHYGGITDHAIEVRFPFSAKFVFWKQASYIPWWDVEQVAMTNEFVEAWGGGNQGCNEPMQDREGRYIKVELLENSPARVKVHWRYALSDPHYNIYFNEWVDEYYYLYPDGVGGRQVNLWPNSSTRHESFEVLLAKPPGVQTKQLFDQEFATLTNLKGEGYSNKYLNKNRDFHRNFIAEHKEFVVEVHFKERLHPFTVFALREELLPGTTPDRVTVCARDVGHADRRGHWPASRYQIDGYNTPGLDVPHHGNIGNVQAMVDKSNQPTTWTYLIGVAEEESEKPMRYAKSWLYPGEFVSTYPSTQYDGYSFAQRAYLFTIKPQTPNCHLTFVQEKTAIENPVLIFSGSDQEVAEVLLNKAPLDQKKIKSGRTRSGDTILFLETSLQGDQTLSVMFK